MPELMATLEVSRELDYTEKKFLAAIQGVDLDGESNKNRGLLSSDKPRGELVRKTEDAKRASCPEGIGKCAGNAILSLAQKVL